MSMGGLLFFLLLLAGCALLIAGPLLRREPRNIKVSDQHFERQRERLIAYYERVLNNLRDLDEDHATGKMPEGAYWTEREEWTERGVQVLKTLDSLNDHSIVPDSARDDAAVDEAIDDAIETAIRSYRKAEG